MENKENKNNYDETNNESRIKLDLLKKEIYKSIATEFSISNKTAEELAILKKDAGINSHEKLKLEVETNENINIDDRNVILGLTNDRLKNLYSAILGAEKLTNKDSISNIEFISIGEKSSFTQKKFPKLYEKGFNPENNSDQIIGLCLGGIDSCSATIKYLFDLGDGIIKSPKHTYLIISGKAKYKDLSRMTFLVAFIITFFSLSYIVYYFLI
ncbi:hypothetical protein EOM39_00800 [Candidatus Gracilibacteria bacterium]|nr:hypothetical protein [Candidatus Gracilibacteria bacterium]